MKTSKRLMEMVLRGKNVQFKNILEEELQERAAILMEAVFKKEAEKCVHTPVLPVKITESVELAPKVLVENTINSVLVLKDGNTVKLTESQVNDISKLYKNLNNDNKERMVKLLSESIESVNRILKIARLK